MLNSDATQCVELEIETNLTSYSYATQTAASVGVASSVVSSSVSGGSPQGAWAMINQLQILILLPLMIDNFNSKVRDYILSMDFALFSFDFISLNGLIPHDSKKALNFDQQNEYLGIMGLESGSALKNNFGLLLMITILAFFHLFLWPLYCKFKHRRSRLAKLVKYLWYFMTLTIYIRLFIEAFIIICLSNIFEIKYYAINNHGKTVSFVFACLVTFIAFCLLTITFIIWKSYNKIQEIHNKYCFKEILRY